MKKILAVMIFLSLGSFGNRTTAAEVMDTLVFDKDPTMVSLETTTGGLVSVSATPVRVVKIMPVGEETTVLLHTCNATGCLPAHDVAVGADEAIVKMDLVFSSPQATDADAGNAYFKPQQARFKADGVSLPVFELRRNADNWLEREASFYVEPMKQIQQTLFTRVRKDAQSITLVYGSDMNQPALALQACFSEGCNLQRNQTLKPVVPESQPNAECQINGTPVPCDEVVQQIGTFAKMGLGIIIGLIVFGTLCTIFWVMMLVHAARHPIEHKAVWIVAMLFLNIPVSLAYYFAVKRPFDATQKVTTPAAVFPTPPTTPSPMV